MKLPWTKKREYKPNIDKSIYSAEEILQFPKFPHPETVEWCGEWTEYGPVGWVIAPSGGVISEQAAMLQQYDQRSVRCRYCGTKSHPVDKFCSGCGAPL